MSLHLYVFLRVFPNTFSSVSLFCPILVYFCFVSFNFIFVIIPYMLIGFLSRKRKAEDSARKGDGKDLGRVVEETVIRTLYEKYLCSIKER